jgi:hypothetical protein
MRTIVHYHIAVEVPEGLSEEEHTWIFAKGIDELAVIAKKLGAEKKKLREAEAQSERMF